MNLSRWLRPFILVLILLIGGVFTYFLLLPSTFDLKAKNISIIGSDADLTIDQMHVVQNKQGNKNWEMWANTAKIYRKKNLTELETIHIRYYPKNGKPLDITADKGEMETDSRNMLIRGNVLIKTSAGYTLHTDSLRFRPKDKRIDTDAKILLEGNSFNLTGVGLHGQTDTGLYALNHRVKAVIYNTGANAFAAKPKQTTLTLLPQSGPPSPEGSTP
ncbi:MAG: LPS export ABC transporter periplasmic protein LptC [Nitrospinaceae bacterium]|jgi:LPS export ABC transporter protein LptC|nr:LPS export ABC transporter periplasmic protein LptC [Nitrospinaceae bacterium]MBT3434500.1 LPS export ABC transporter periplasmic protein LptC [Nitrospinaceae bacterium]MBT3823094.1 LPS export ABC transporter periplasmic protein LptC [Nitrospinaceae bacterium]MBT4093322.1 LPS export ABC transporter periplasmic protein LptC [Nitrospinaceae bacterium]MBT4432287.1 LPS export ABC transporter periplasmic protein LptC [Nitrospinaceae bacterium]